MATIPTEPWPNAVDLAATLAFLTIVFVLPLLGYVFIVLDIRKYLRSLRRGLSVVAARTFSAVPSWSRAHTPRAIAALGLTLPCTEAQVMHAYRQRVKVLHPDHGGDQRRFLMLQRHFEEALSLLRDARPRAA